MIKAQEIVKEYKMRGEKISFQDAMEMSMDSSNAKISVTSSDLYNNFYRTLDRIKSEMNSKENKNEIFESSASGKGKYLILMIIAVFILITVKPFIDYGDYETLLFAILFPRNGIYYIDRKSYRCNKNA